MNYQETLDYLYNSLPMYQRVGGMAFKKDLTNTLALCRHLGDPHKRFASVHIAGTNGKGSSAHSLAAILQAAGYKVGLYTSPHLRSFTERIKINGTEIGEQAVVDFVHENQKAIQKIGPSFFEMTVAMAFDAFARQKVDIAVVEVGLGGRLDSTNVITPEVSLITNISLDHTDMLGNTLEAIAFEKAGIIKENTPVVVSERQPEVAHVFEEQAKTKKAPLFFAEDHYSLVRHEQQPGEIFIDIYRDGKQVFADVLLSGGGLYYLKNMAGVLQTVDVLVNKGWGISPEAIRKGLAAMQSLTGLKGRWQVLAIKPLTICDTAHNEAGIQVVLQQLLALPCKKLHFVLGMVREKDVEKILRLFPAQARYYLCQPQIPRALEVERLASVADALHLEYVVVPDVNEAIAKAKSLAGDEDIIYIGGSTFVVAEIESL